MTVFDATTLLYGWFSNNDSFNMERDFLKLVTLTENPDEDKAAVNCGLRKWEELNMVDRDGEYWVLTKKLSSLEQTLTITADSALIISTFTSKYADVIKDDTYLCDPCNIQEKDLQYLLGLCNDLINSEK